MEKSSSRVSWVLTILLFFNFSIEVRGSYQVPAIFVFGDSLVDNGNNNNLYSLAKANYFPYGIDFYQGPSGRFSNGKTAADMWGETLGFRAMLSGVNYPSVAGGILDETGQHLLWVINPGNMPKKAPTATYQSSLSYHGSAVNVLRFSPSGNK